MKSPEKVKDHIVNWLKKYLKNSKQNGFIVGISGGIDSALTSTLCALTNYPVFVVEMPIHQSESEVSRSKAHMKWLKKKYKNVKSITHSLTNVFESFKKEIELHEKPNLLGLANTRARLRMTTLYYFASSFKCIVAGTGNKVEDFGVGFYTKYGDGGVDISPIADLLKSEVFSLSSYLKISKNILTAKPTDGLWDDGRTDEQQMGANYSDLELAMNLVETKKDEKSLTEKERQLKNLFEKLQNQNKHKMHPIPVCKIPKNYL